MSLQTELYHEISAVKSQKYLRGGVSYIMVLAYLRVIKIEMQKG